MFRSYFLDEIATCLVNPRACYETELIFKETNAIKNIAVIGAGPAGLSFATYAASRGHKVKVFDSNNQIGGQFNIAKTIPGKEEFYETLRYFKRQIELQPNIELVLNHTVTYEELSQANYDEIVVATGVTPRQLQFEGIDHPKVLSYIQVPAKNRPFGCKFAPLRLRRRAGLYEEHLSHTVFLFCDPGLFVHCQQ
jgi:2,4-dienoyl-CoA reductase (NADPH2)